MGLSSFDRERLIRINFIINELYDLVSKLYESMCDKDDEQIEDDICSLRGLVENLEDSIRKD